MPSRHPAGPSLTVADILVRFHQAYLDRHGSSMRTDQRSALQSILLCRTPAMGGRSYRCARCSAERFAWRSCNHRLCPRCGAADTAEWVAARLEGRLPVAHFMATFTLPAQLRVLCGYGAAKLYKLLLSASAQALKDVLKEPRHLGGECGFVGMLQTWTQDLRLHPHVHYIVPAIALGPDGRIRHPRSPRWLARGEVLAARLRTLLLKALEREGLLPAERIRELWAIKWNCDVEDFGDGSNALKYLGAYACKGPISDSRILDSDGRTVTISVRNRRTGTREAVRMDGAEFVRRYLQHALPSGLHRIRYHGFMHGRSKAKLASIRDQLESEAPPEAKPGRRPKPEPFAPPPGFLCPKCREPMECVGYRSRAPPQLRSIARIWNHAVQPAA